MASYFEYIVPEATTNELDDPAFDLADPDTEWAITGDGSTPDFTRSTDEQYFGTGCALADIDDGSFATVYQSITVTAAAWMLSARVKRAAGGVLSASECTSRWDTAYEAQDGREKGKESNHRRRWKERET